MYTHLFYKQPHLRVEPRVAIKFPKMRLEVIMKLLSIFRIEAQGCLIFYHLSAECIKNKQNWAKFPI